MTNLRQLNPKAVEAHRDPQLHPPPAGPDREGSHVFDGVLSLTEHPSSPQHDRQRPYSVHSQHGRRCQMARPSLFKLPSPLPVMPCARTARESGLKPNYDSSPKPDSSPALHQCVVS